MRDHRPRVRELVITLALGAGACQIVEVPPGPAELGTFPYHPLVFELDLSILAYQLHGQSLVWPIDPYFEEHAETRGTSRDALMTSVKSWAVARGNVQRGLGSGLDAIRGPGSLAGQPNNDTHDPILYNYARIHPWSANIVNMDGRWTEYLTPEAITQRIREVHVAALRIGDLDDTIDVMQVVPGRADAAPDARDVLCAFEGETGAREASQAGSYSLVGFVLARDTPGGYDAHVTFRGSRSGSAFRAASDALDSIHAKGNPDWITDLGWDTVPAKDVTAIGGVHRGFARTITSTMPAAYACLAKVAELRNGEAPANIYVTGHSLGGALAQQFTSAVLIGEARDAMPASIHTWPWATIKLVSFSAPRAGDYAWASALSGDALESPFYDPGPLETVDADARLLLDPGIVARLHDASRPAGFRVLISTDPITTTKFGGDGTHVGTTVYVNGDDFLDWVGVDLPEDHEPEKVRRLMLEQLDDTRTPRTAWRYRPLEDFVSMRHETERGTPGEMQKLADGLVGYYEQFGQYFDAMAFRRDLELRFGIERGTTLQ